MAGGREGGRDGKKKKKKKCVRTCMSACVQGVGGGACNLKLLPIAAQMSSDK